MVISPSRRIVLVFAKAPVSGQVKTRLAEVLGHDEAARIYRTIAGRVVNQLRGGRFRTVIFHDPLDAGEVFRDWFGPDGLEFEGQPKGGLGERLAEGFRWGFGQGDLVCAVGTDAPRLDRALVEGAFDVVEAQTEPGAAFGPTTDGGYYLVALNQVVPGLFEDIPWSTSDVLRSSLERAEVLGVSTCLLSPLSDVDRPEDVPPELLSTMRPRSP
jgi:rSAM/selenodomain-associated transferase 1